MWVTCVFLGFFSLDSIEKLTLNQLTMRFVQKKRRFNFCTFDTSSEIVVLFQLIFINFSLISLIIYMLKSNRHVIVIDIWFAQEVSYRSFLNLLILLWQRIYATIRNYLFQKLLQFITIIYQTTTAAIATQQYYSIDEN